LFGAEAVGVAEEGYTGWFAFEFGYEGGYEVGLVVVGGGAGGIVMVGGEAKGLNTSTSNFISIVANTTLRSTTTILKDVTIIYVNFISDEMERKFLIVRPTDGWPLTSLEISHGYAIQVFPRGPVPYL